LDTRARRPAGAGLRVTVSIRGAAAQPAGANVSGTTTRKSLKESSTVRC